MFALWLCTLPFFYVHFAGGVGLLLSVLAATFAAWLAASAFAMIVLLEVVVAPGAAALQPPASS